MTAAVITVAQADITLSDQTDCNPVNGSAEVMDILVDGVATGSVAGYTFTWFQIDGTTVIPGSSSNALIGTPLSAGDYFVNATNVATNCSSSVTPFTIKDLP